MTSLAFILGVVPLAVATGASSASRHSIGTGVIGGMLAATFIASCSSRCSSGWSRASETNGPKSRR
jgi:Cu/Ag efflux pump CusA